MKRFLSLLLCAAIMIGGLCFPALAEQQQETNNPHYTDASAAEAMQNAAISYDENLGAIRIAAAEGGTVIANIKLDETAAEQLNLVFWVPATNQNQERLTLSCGDWSDTYAGIGGHTFNRYTYTGVTGDTLNVSFDAAAADSIYLYIATGETFSDDNWTAFTNTANGGCSLTEEELFLNKYEVERYTKEYWNTSDKIVYNESFFVMENEDGSVEPIQLMHDIDRIVSVQDSYLKKEYVYGVDYTLEDGKLIILPDGGITPYRYSHVYKNTAGSGWWEMLEGGYVYGGQHAMFMTGYLNITYTYSDASTISLAPEAKGHLLNRTLTKLENGETVKTLAVGDSITGGANCSSSSDVNAEPYADIWHEMAAKKLQLLYPDAAIEHSSIYQGGATAQFCVEKIDEIVAADPDLIIIEFGTNDCMQNDPASLYIQTLQEAIAAIQENLPDCDIILTPPSISNTQIFPLEWFDAYADALYALEEEGIAVADITSMMRELLQRKRYLDMTGDNLCHPNDFVSRLFAQVIVTTVSRSDSATVISQYQNRLQRYRYENEYYPEQWAEIQALMNEGVSAIGECETEKDAAALLAEYKAKINVIETKKEVDAGAVLYPEKLIFNAARAMDAVSNSIMVYKKYDAAESALLGTVFGNNPLLRFDYTVGEQPVQADDYGYLVLTAKASSRRGKAAIVRYRVDGLEEDEYLEDVSVPLTLDDKYHSYVVNLTELAGWTGTVQELTLKLFDRPMNNDYMLISSLILCADETSAQSTARERERIANKETAPAITNLFDSDAATSALQSEITYLRGDIDNDGAVTAVDAFELVRYLADANSCYANKWRLHVDPDSDDDDVLMSDALYLRQILANIRPADTLTLKTADVSFEAAQDAARIDTLTEDAAVQIDLSGLNCSADVYKYLTLCLKSTSAQPFTATVTITTDTGSSSADITFAGDTMFEAASCGFSDISGTVQSMYITFRTPTDGCIYLDSYVFTASAAAAQNAEIVRVGAANLVG